MMPPRVQAPKYVAENSSIFLAGVTAPGACGFPAVVDIVLLLVVLVVVVVVCRGRLPMAQLKLSWWWLEYG